MATCGSPRTSSKCGARCHPVTYTKRRAPCSASAMAGSACAPSMRTSSEHPWRGAGSPAAHSPSSGGSSARPHPRRRRRRRCFIVTAASIALPTWASARPARGRAMAASCPLGASAMPRALRLEQRRPSQPRREVAQRGLAARVGERRPQRRGMPFEALARVRARACRPTRGRPSRWSAARAARGPRGRRLAAPAREHVELGGARGPGQVGDGRARSTSRGRAACPSSSRVSPPAPAGAGSASRQRVVEVRRARARALRLVEHELPASRGPSYHQCPSSSVSSAQTHSPPPRTRRATRATKSAASRAACSAARGRVIDGAVVGPRVVVAWTVRRW